MYSSSSGPVSPPGLPPPPPPKPGEGRPEPAEYQPIPPRHLQQQHYTLQQQQQQQQEPPPNLPPTQQYVRSPPPVPPQGTQQSSSSAPQVPPLAPSSSPSSSSQQQQIPPWLPNTLSSHTTADLTSLLNNPTILASLSTQHPSYSASQQPLLQLLSQTTSLARSTLHLQSQLTAERATTTQLLLQHTALHSQWHRKQREMDQALDPWAPRAIYQRLTQGIAEQEQLVRAVTESFMDAGAGGGERSEREVAEWIKRVREAAVVLEKRREMKARWDEGRVGGWR